MWTYYRQDFPNGVFSLLREDERHNEEIFHRKAGWQLSDELSKRKAMGDVDQDDIVTAQEAEALIGSLGAPG